MSAIHSLIKFLGLRWEFLITLAVALGFLTAATLAWNLGLAMVGAIAAFAAGEARASQILCNDCALDMVITDPEITAPV